MFNVTITTPSSIAIDLTTDYRLGLAYNMSLDSSVSTPTANVSINECQVTCLHSDELLSLGIIEGSKIEITDENTTKLFTGYITTINNRVSSDTNTVVYMCHDCLKGILDKTIPNFKIEKQITLGSFLTKLFSSLGISNFSIESSLSSNVLDFAFLVGSKVGEFFNTLSVAYNMYIYVDALGVIQFKSKSIDSGNTTSLGGNNYIVNTKLGSSLSNSYSVVKVGYSHTTIQGNTLVLEIKDITINSGLNNLNSYTLSSSNLYAVNFIKVISTTNTVVLKDYTASQTDISLVLENSGDTPEQCTIQVYGYCLGVTESFIEKENANAIGKIGRKELSIANKLIQTESHANEIADKLLGELVKSVPYIECSVVNINHFKLGQVLSITSTKLDVTFKGYIHSVKGSLSSNTLCKGVLLIKVI